MPPLLWAEFSFQYIIPFIFLVIWVMNQIFGRSEAAAARAKVGPRPLPPGPSRAPQTPSRAPSGARPGPSTARTTPAARQPNRAPNRAPAGASGRPKSTTTASQGRNQNQAQAPSTPQAKGSGEPTKPSRSPIPDEIYAIYDDDRMSPRSGDQSLSAPTSSDTSRSGPDLSSATTSIFSATGLDPVLLSRVDADRLREAIILNEILGRPVALRGGRGTIMMPRLPKPPAEG